MTHTDLFKRIHRIEIQTRKLVHQRLAGGYHSVFKGRGIEFEHIREYVPGDDVRMIDWNATARFDRPFVKLYVEERELTMMLLVDVSASMRFGSTERSKQQLATEFCATIAFSAISNNDRVGLLLFTDRVVRMIPPKKGRRHILRLIRELLTAEAGPGQTSVGAALEAADRLMPRSGTLFVVSDFYTPACRRALLVAGKRHDAIAVTIRDPREVALDALPEEGLYALEDPETGDVRLVDLGHGPTREALLDWRTQQARGWARELGKADVDEIRLSTAEPFDQPLVDFFRRRSRRLQQGV